MREKKNEICLAICLKMNAVCFFFCIIVVVLWFKRLSKTKNFSTKIAFKSKSKTKMRSMIFTYKYVYLINERKREKKKCNGKNHKYILTSFTDSDVLDADFCTFCPVPVSDTSIFLFNNNVFVSHTCCTWRFWWIYQRSRFPIWNAKTIAFLFY